MSVRFDVNASCCTALNLWIIVHLAGLRKFVFSFENNNDLQERVTLSLTKINGSVDLWVIDVC